VPAPAPSQRPRVAQPADRSSLGVVGGEAGRAQLGGCVLEVAREFLQDVARDRVG